VDVDGLLGDRTSLDCASAAEEAIKPIDARKLNFTKKADPEPMHLREQEHRLLARVYAPNPTEGPNASYKVSI
jgi:hypothetical protein